MGKHIGTGGFPAIEDAASGGEVQERFRGMKLEDAKALLQEEFRVSASRAHEIMRLRKALEFYADDDNWQDGRPIVYVRIRHLVLDKPDDIGWSRDDGDIARAALRARGD